MFDDRGSVLQLRTAVFIGCIDPCGITKLLNLGVMKLPGNGIEKPDQRGFADTAFEERVGGKSAEGVIADFAIGGRGSTSDQVQVAVGRDCRSIEQN